jgi:hypothetical protein
VIERYPDALLYPTMQGGGTGTTIERRAVHMQDLIDAGLLRLAPIDMGTSNMSFLDEVGLLGASDDLRINANSDAHFMFDFCTRNRVGASIGCVEPGFVRTAMTFTRAGKVPQDSIFRLVFGGRRTLMGPLATRAALDIYLEMIEDAAIPWNIGTFGGDAFENGFAQYAMERAVALAAKIARPVAMRAETNAILDLPRAA